MRNSTVTWRRGNWAPAGGPDRWQRHHLGQIGQLLPPVGQLPGDHTVADRLEIAQPIPLPQRVIHVLHRQRSPARALALPARSIRLGPRSRTIGAIDQPSKAMWCTTFPAHAASGPPNRSAHESGSRLPSQTDTPPAPSVRWPHPARAAIDQPRHHRAATSPPGPATPAGTAHHLVAENSGAQRFVAGDDIIEGRSSASTSSAR